VRNILNKRLPVIFSALAAIFLALSIVSGIASQTALRHLSSTNYDNSGLAAVQIRLHYSLLLAELGNLEAKRPGAAVAEASLQFDILYDRVRSLPTRPPYNEVLTAQDLQQIERIFSKIDDEATRFDAAVTEGAQSLMGVSERLTSIRDDVNLLAGRIVQLMRVYRDARRNDIIHATRFLIFSTIGLVLNGAVFAFLLWRSQFRLQRQNQTLTNVTDQLRSANRTKSEFLASISHELRTPLNAIIGFSDMINRQVMGPLGDKKYLEYSNDIKLSGTHLLNLINDILDLSKIEAGEFRIQPEFFALTPLIHEAVRIADMRADRAVTRFNVNVADGLDTLYADPRSVRQVLINLLSNADKYSPSDAPIDIVAQRDDGGGVHIMVIDRGIGIPKHDLELVLEPFGQSRQNSDQTHEGTGLGLALSKQFMELNGGSLSLESEPGVGTTVHLRFPNRIDTGDHS